MHHMTEYSQLKLDIIQWCSPIFKAGCVATNIWKILNTIALIWCKNMLEHYFVHRHYLFFKAHSFPWAMLSENCSLLRTDNVRAQISEHTCNECNLYIRDICMLLEWPGLLRSREMRGLVKLKRRGIQELRYM